ncbi:MAG: hypothetical protein IJY61_01845 [Candidatus Gastranaerophilales bacterium]|nr:hypothetical protein [Candidatus Gastranaerophilales bacterium]
MSLRVGSINTINVSKSFRGKLNTKNNFSSGSYCKNLTSNDALFNYYADALLLSKTFVNISEKTINKKEKQMPSFSSIDSVENKSYQAFRKDVKFKEPRYVIDGEYRYMLIEPTKIDDNQRLPLIVYLPGTGEYKSGQLGTVGYVDKNLDGSISDDEVKHNALGTILKNSNLKDFNGYVIAPSLECVDSNGWATPVAEKYVRGIVSNFADSHNVNEDKVFIGGHSIGGIGTMYMATHAADIFSKAFVLSGFAHSSYDIKNISMPIIGYNGKGDSSFMEEDFIDVFGKENFVRVDTKHGSVPINVFNRDADGDDKSDLFEWLLEDQSLPENSDEY